MDFKEQLVRYILKNTQYGGNTKKEQKEISASSIDEDLLALYYKYKYGVIEKNDINQATLGTIFGDGFEAMLSSIDNIKTQYTCKPLKLKSGWNLTGSCDVVNIEDGYVADIKLTKKYTLQNFMKNQPDTSYAYQLNAYRKMLENEHNKEFKMYLLFFLKDASFDYKTLASDRTLEIVEVERNDIAIDIAEEKTEQLNFFIDNNEVPDKCTDVWMRKLRNGTTVPIRCHLYCGYKDKCKHFNPHPATAAAMINW